MHIRKGEFSGTHPEVPLCECLFVAGTQRLCTTACGAIQDMEYMKASHTRREDAILNFRHKPDWDHWVGCKV